ncbi:MAG: GNAT family N-acetyltransferase [Ruminiclostridium sp.]|nr:GNAT family N-acetyltransferase [Ruminiclostridium sp.]
MNIYSVKNNAELCEKVKQYCKKNWNKVYEVFSETADLSIKSDKLPQTWVLEQDNEIMGFYQLVYNDKLTYYTDLSPFVATLFVDEGARGHRYSEIMLTHAKSETTKLGYDKLYVSTDHIGFYEKFGFKEIGLDIYTWGSPTKIYEGYTVHLSEIFQNY